jgi:hypothetical protein
VTLENVVPAENPQMGQKLPAAQKRTSRVGLIVFSIGGETGKCRFG